MDRILDALGKLHDLGQLPMWAWAIAGVAAVAMLVKSATAFFQTLDKADGRQDMSGICWLLLALVIVEAPFAILGVKALWGLITHARPV